MVIGYLIIVNFPILLTFPWFFLLIPIGIGFFFLLLFISLLVTIIAMKFCNRAFPPHEGSFDLDLSVKDIRGWMYRRTIKSFALLLFGLVKINTLKVLMLRSFGIKIGKNVKLYGMVIDDPFIEIGDNFILGRRAVIAGHLYDHIKLTFNKTIIGNNCIIEPVAGAVGATLGDNTIIKHGCGALRGQRTRGNGIFKGVPMSRVGNYSDLTPEEVQEIHDLVDLYNKRDIDEEKLRPIKINSWKFNIYKMLMVIVGLLAVAGIGLLYYFTLFQLLYFQLGGFLGVFLALVLIPFFILMGIVFFVLPIIFITKKIVTPSVPEGEYELDSAEASEWKFKYLVKKFCLSVIHSTPFAILDVFVLMYLGNKIGKNCVIKEGLVDPEYLDLGDYVIISALSRVHTHNIIDGKLVLKGIKIGDKVVLGGVSHLDVGAEVGENSLLGIATYVKPNKKLKPNALYMGKPAIKYPKDLLKKIWIEPKKEYE